ncbi:MAG: YqzL family protein [Cellulosilyticaceae bacterium]
MLQDLWKCFETTGDINHYLAFREYEDAYHNMQGETPQVNTMVTGEGE